MLLDQTDVANFSRGDVMHEAMQAGLLSLAVLGAEMSIFPPESECQERYEIACRVLSKIGNQINLFPHKAKELGLMRDDFQWHKDFWWAAWWVRWWPASVEQRLNWMIEARKLREHRFSRNWPQRLP